MLKDIVEARPLEGHRLYVRFEDGVEGVINIAELVSFEGVFEPLKEHSHFLQVRVNSELGTVCWPGGADLDPDVLYAVVAGIPIPPYPDRVPIEAPDTKRRGERI
jgi:hypothetical protein